MPKANTGMRSAIRAGRGKPDRLWTVPEEVVSDMGMLHLPTILRRAFPDIDVGRGLEDFTAFARAEIVDIAVVDTRFRGAGLHGLAAHRVDVRLGRHPAQLRALRRRRAGVGLRLSVPVPQDGRAPAEAHHQKEEPGPKREVDKRGHLSPPPSPG